ncbi:energy-coupled thiamine transporter ThiT [Listeria weihenstephanensis]|uniref:Energy-coupled thiamine transporter ThiT n=1 Tax=Listeria weihenstephanensis TaxID=1006155 RepID=A0A841Z9D5_9LIST|nr:energy-coupled thiamine transporter ThiT [Listeria weihenstephanensis]MBC1501810.1 energy-coupled thiamine transporter ThiT [Listeria weihenstephanensis]
MRNTRLLTLLECAIFAAIAMVLSFIPLDFGSSLSISLGMIPMYIIAIRRGFWAAGFSGLLWGILHFVTGKAYILSPLQGVLEYIVAFLFIAFAGVFAVQVRGYLKEGKLNKAIGWAWATMIIGGVARYFWHYLAGVLFWGAYAFKGWSAQLFSLVMNGASCILTIVVAGIIVSILMKISPKLFLPK